ACVKVAAGLESMSREGKLVAASSVMRSVGSDIIVQKTVRCRSGGDMTCTAAVESNAATLDEVVSEIILTRISERGETRIDDRVTEAAMEDRKKGGYF